MINIGTLFSGIGAFECALKRCNIEHKVLFACDNDKYCKQTYFLNHNCESWFDDVHNLDATQYLNQIDILMGGSPCQSFSIAGQRKGFKDARGNLFFEFTRVIRECKPKVFIFENVKHLAFSNKGEDFKIVLNEFISLGYDIHYKILNAIDYGIPQQRNRLFVVGFLEKRDFKFPEPIPLTTNVFDYLDKEVDDKYILSPRGKAYVLAKHPFNNTFQIDRKIAKTLTTKGSGLRAKFGNYYSYKNELRCLTPLEYQRLMGFYDDFKFNVSNTQIYKQLGNSIVINVLVALLYSISEHGERIILTD